MELEKNLKDAGHTLNVENSKEDNNIGWMLKMCKSFSIFRMH